MRRRKPAGGDDETLNQPLLSEDADGADAPREPSAGADDEVFDNEWLDQNASYMEFSSVMESTKDRVRLALERAGKARGGCTLEGVRDALGLDGVVVA